MGDFVQAQSEEEKPFNVLITGFGAFRYTTINPSWESVKLLTKHRSIDSDRSDRRSLKIDAAYIPVEYEYIQQALPYYHGNSATKPALPTKCIENTMIAARDDFSSSKTYDLYLHVGQGRSGGVQLETCGHQLGYRLLDASGKLAPIVAEQQTATDKDALIPEQSMSDTEREAGLNRGYRLPAGAKLDLDDEDRLVSKLDTAKHAALLSTQFPSIAIKQSLNAGRYLCEFIYFGSMAEAVLARQASHEAERSSKFPAVLFVHVPPADDPVSIADMADVLHNLIVNIMASR